jgi:hypothetical protein
MPNEEKGGVSLEALTLGEVGLSSLGSTVNLMTQIKDLLYQISSNPLLAIGGSIMMERQLGTLAKYLVSIKQEAKDAGGSMKLLQSIVSNPTSMMIGGNALLALGLRLRGVRDELEKGSVAMTRYIRDGMTPMQMSTNLTKQQIQKQIDYSKDFADQYGESFKKARNILTKDPAFKGNKENQDRMLEIITGLSIGTGADMGDFLQRYMQKFSKVGGNTPMAMGFANEIRKGMDAGDLSFDNLNSQLETAIELMEQFQRTGMDMSSSMAAAFQMLKIGGKLGLSNADLQVVSQLQQNLATPGRAGIEERVKLFGGYSRHGTSAQGKEDLARAAGFKNAAEMDKSGGVGQEKFATAIQGMARNDPAGFMRFMQGYVRNIVKQNPYAIEGQGKQLETEFFAGANRELITTLAGSNQLEAGFGNMNDNIKKLNDATEKMKSAHLKDIDPEFDAILRKAGTWLESIGGFFKSVSVGLSSALGDEAIFGVIAAGGILSLVGTFRKLSSLMKAIQTIAKAAALSLPAEAISAGALGAIPTAPLGMVSKLGKVPWMSVVAKISGWLLVADLLYNMYESINENAPEIRKRREEGVQDERSRNQGFYTAAPGSLATPTLPGSKLIPATGTRVKTAPIVMPWERNVVSSESAMQLGPAAYGQIQSPTGQPTVNVQANVYIDGQEYKNRVVKNSIDAVNQQAAETPVR